MLIWGSDGETIDLGSVETRRCDTCEKDRQFNLFLQYKYWHIWYLFSWVSKKLYMLLCEVCHRGVEIDSKKIESKLEKNPIPFRRRYGWAFLVALIAILMVWSTIESKTQEANDYAYIKSPSVNDYYVVDFSKIIEKAEQSPMYSIMKIKAVDGESAEFLLPNVWYNLTSGTDKDIVIILLKAHKFSQDNVYPNNI